MDITQAILRLLRRSKKPEAIQSEESVIEAPNQSQINQSITESPKETTMTQLLTKPTELSPPVELQKDSLQLGIAAGYTGRALREIESSLVRIESQIVTKDWFSNQFLVKTTELLDLLKKHDENEEARFEIIQNSLLSLQKTAETAPEPVKTQLFEHIKTIEGQLPLTRKMQQLVLVIKESREISYSDLATKLGISESALRGLLSTTVRRTNDLERFEKLGKGWVRYKQMIEAPNQSQINQSGPQ
jgi:hypothetical protein